MVKKKRKSNNYYIHELFTADTTLILISLVTLEQQTRGVKSKAENITCGSDEKKKTGATGLTFIALYS